MIREFVKELDDSAWADLEGIGLDEFRESMNNPEFSFEGTLVAEIDGQIVGIVDAHVSPSFSEFCVLRTFKVKNGWWNLVAQPLLDAAFHNSAGFGRHQQNRFIVM
jgi:hypothetical protein